MEACPWGEPWRDFLASLLWGGAEGLYILSQLVLSVYAVWYIASLGAYFASTPTKAGPATGAWGGDYPRVAVVYPVYNDYEVLASLEKALNMDYPDYKIVVVDDSDDDRLSSRISEVASRSGGRVIHVRRAGRRGLKAGALNTAARIARELGAKYMLVLDADFEPERGLLRRMVSIAETTGADIVQGHQAHRKGADDFFGLLIADGDHRYGSAGAVDHLNRLLHRIIVPFIHRIHQVIALDIRAVAVDLDLVFGGIRNPFDTH